MNAMTEEEDKIIRFHEKMALLCAMNTHAFNDFCLTVFSSREGFSDRCVDFFLYGLLMDCICLLEKYDDLDDLEISRYHIFCKNRLVEERDFSHLNNELTRSKDVEWLDFFDGDVFRRDMLLYLAQKDDIDDVDIAKEVINGEIELSAILSYCDELKRHRILFDTLVSLLFNAICKEKELDTRVDCCRLLKDALIDNKEHDYSKSSFFYSALIQLSSDVREAFFKGFGMSIKEYDSLLSFIDRGKEDDAILEIANMRKNDMLVNDSILIEYCVDFQKAQKSSQYLDWSRRFSFMSNLRPINALLLKTIQELHLISLETVNSLISSVCPDFDVKRERIPLKRKTKKNEGNNGSHRQDYDRYLPNSVRSNVDKEKLIDLLINHRWVAGPKGCDERELRIRLNYFFDNGEKVEQKPNDIDGYTIRWRETPKGPLLNLLINLLYNRKPESEVNGSNVILRPEPGFGDLKNLSFTPGVNSTLFGNLFNNTDSPVWEIVRKVFNVSARDGKIRTGTEKTVFTNLDKLQNLANDFFSCRKKNSCNPS